MRLGFYPTRMIGGAMLGAWLALFAAPIQAQDPAEPVEPATPAAQVAAPDAAPADDGKEKEEPPEPEEIVLRTDDGLRIKATYYAGMRGEKSAVVLMLHDFKSNRNAFRSLALALQKEGCAVLAPDLRGHGGSTQFHHPLTGQVAELLASDMRRDDFEAIVRFDIEVLRRFLRDENNAKKLNLNALCIVGAEMGAIAAARWTALDWSAPPLPVGKQGQDVKALVLISPPWTYQSIPMAPALNHELVRSNVSLLVLAGARDSGAVRDARRAFNAVERFHNKPADPAQEEVLSLTWDTTLQGTQLLATAELNVDEPIRQFIKRRVVEQAYPWSPRIALVSSQ